MGTRLNAATVNVASFQRPPVPGERHDQLDSRETRFQVRRRLSGPAHERIQLPTLPHRFLREPWRRRDGKPSRLGKRRYGHAVLRGDNCNPGPGQTYASLWAATATNTQAFNFRQTSRTIAANLAYLLTDSIGGLNTPYWISSANDASQGIAGWQDITTQSNRLRNSASSDYAFFAKDDYKIRPSLTLNLGLRYEYYAPPYLKDGLTSAIVGLGDGLFGASQSDAAGGQLFNNWLQPGNLFLTNYGTGSAIPAGAAPLDCKTGMQQSPFLPTSTCDPNSLTTIQYVGSGSPNPSKRDSASR